ncbi:MAG: sigma-70 family RNA polymerase sigma factor [Kiloniellales bacterium]
MDDLKDGVIDVIPSLRRYALSLTRDRDAADDLAQDALLRALERQSQFTPGTNLRAWLFAIMHNLFIDQMRRATPLKTSVPLDEYRGSHVTAAAQEPWIELKELASALEGLPLEQRSTLLLVGLEGLSYEEAATVTGVAIGTVKSRLSRAREALRLQTSPPDNEPKSAQLDESCQSGGAERLSRRRAAVEAGSRGREGHRRGCGAAGQAGALPAADQKAAGALRPGAARAAWH